VRLKTKNDGHCGLQQTIANHVTIPKKKPIVPETPNDPKKMGDIAGCNKQ